MNKFLIQINEFGMPVYDFCFHMIEVCNYKTWYNPSNPYGYLLSEDVENGLFGDYIPIGSVEFVHNFLNTYYGIKNVKPINIPTELRLDKY